MMRPTWFPIFATFGWAVVVAWALEPAAGRAQIAPPGDGSHACFFSPRPVELATDRADRAMFECRHLASLGAAEDAVDAGSMVQLRALHRAMFGPWVDGNSSRVDWCAANTSDEAVGRFARVARDMVIGSGDFPVDVFSEGEVLRLARRAPNVWITSAGREIPRDAVVDIPFPTTSRFIDVSACVSRVCAWTRYPEVRLVDARGRERGRVANAFSTIAVASFDADTVQLTNGLRVPRSNVILAVLEREADRVGAPARRLEIDAQEGVIGLVENGELRRVAPFDLRLFDSRPGRVEGTACHVELAVDLKAWWSRECDCAEHAGLCLSDLRTEQYGWVVHAGGSQRATVYFAAPIFGTVPRATGRPVAILEPADAKAVFEWIGPTLAQDAVSIRVAPGAAVAAEVLVSYACEHPWW